MAEGKEFVATVTRKGQVTIPVEIREQLGLAARDKVIFRLGKGNRVEIEPLPMNKIEIGPFGPSADTTGYQPYDAALPGIFAGIQSIILEAIPGASVEHVGSSSIPGIGGRNVVDIAMPCALEIHDAIRIRLRTLGFEDSPFPHYLPLLVASALSNGRNYPILLYVIDPKNKVYQQWVQFRDYMRLHPDDARAYDEVKRRAIADGYGEDGSYQEAKTPFIISLMGKIQEDDC